MCSSSLATRVPGGGHPRAGDRCGWAAGYAQWCWTGSQGQGRIQIWSCVKACKDTRMQKAKCMLRLPFIVLQDLLVDCFKPTEVRFFLPSFLLQYFLFLNPPSCVWSLLSPRRTSSQSCSTRSEGCRSSPHLRRNDGVPPLPSASALTFRLPTALSILLFRCQFSSIEDLVSFRH